MKKNISLFGLLNLLILFIISCENDDDLTPKVSLYDLNKEIVEINVTNTATGLRSVFNDMATDSVSRAHLSQAFVNNAVFFDDDSGYFFIETLNDAWVVAHINQNLIGTSRINAQDINGKYHVQEMVNTVNHRGYGFVEYYFLNPSNGLEESKLSFVTGIDPPGWFIGAGFYNSNLGSSFLGEKEANKLLIKQVVKSMSGGFSGISQYIYTSIDDRTTFFRRFVNHIRFFDDQSGYVFILDTEGIMVAHGDRQDLEGQDLWNLQDSQGNYFTRGLIETALNNPSGGYYQYFWENPANGSEELKTSFVIVIPGTNYILGSGVYQN